MSVMFENTDDWVKEKIRGISHRSRVTFTAAAAAGILAHMYTLTNKLPNYDELTFGAGGVGVTVSSGRWGLEALHQLSILLVGESYSLPWFSGMIAIVFMALAACYVVKFLDIRQDILCVLTGSVLVVYPAFTCAMFFMFTARYYAFAVFLMAWGLYQFDRQLSVASQRKREGVSGYRRSLFFAWLAGIGCVMLATSVFQAYYPLAAGLCVVKLIQMCLGGEAGEYGKVFRKAWIYLAMLVAAVALYILSAKAVAALAGDPLSGYRGMNRLGTIRAAQIPWMVKEIYKSVILLFTSDFYQVNPTAFFESGAGGLLSLYGGVVGGVYVAEMQGKGRCFADSGACCLCADTAVLPEWNYYHAAGFLVLYVDGIWDCDDIFVSAGGVGYGS